VIDPGPARDAPLEPALHLPRLLAGGAVVALLTGTAACGMQAAEPKIALRDAASNFAAGRSGALELSIASSADEVHAFMAAVDSSTGETAMADEDLATLLSSSLGYGYDLGADRKDVSDDAARFVVNVGDLEAGEFVAVGDFAYARVDLDGLAKQFPEMQEGLDSFRAGLSGEGDAAMPQELVAPATALLDGDWISLNLQAYIDQLKEMSAGEGADPAGMGFSEETAAKARDLFGAALKDAVTSVERKTADEELGDHLVASVDLRKAYAKLRSDLPGLLTGEMADSAEKELPPVDEIPDRQFDVSFWVRDGDLTRVELDVAQFLDKPAGHLLLRADVLPAEKITAPSDAVEFDFEAIAAASTAYASTGGDAALAGGENLDAPTIATWVDQDIASSATEDGGTPSVDYLPTVLPYYDGIAPGLAITAVGAQIQVAVDQDVVCLTLSADGMGENVVPGPC
jgi:hypothetical protein